MQYFRIVKLQQRCVVVTFPIGGIVAKHTYTLNMLLLPFGKANISTACVAMISYHAVKILSKLMIVLNTTIFICSWFDLSFHNVGYM